MTLRCAIYTRKSSEEGLEQSFNSLDAQREAGEAYIKSQAHEGWRLVKTHYDDGGISGGTLERSALQKLLKDIEFGKINIVVVYKVDRLTRSLSDFAKLIDVFEKHKVSFVSVTQQFSTTSSMGRLTLNVLLSFAQFEREVTGERIRDKFTASRKKGMWMGGFPPIGYDIKERKLVANKKDAKIVREIFELYLEVKNLSKLTEVLKERGYQTRSYISASGRHWGGCCFSRGHLAELLQNRVYIGDVVHKGKVYAGEHEAIISQELWGKVQVLMSQNRHASRVSKNAKGSSLLKGLLYDDAGNRMSPTYGMRRQKKYRYYVSRALLEGRTGEAGSVARVQAQELEAVVLAKQKIDRIERVVISEDQIMIHCRDDETIKVKYKAALHKGRVKFLDENGAEMIPSKPNPVLIGALIRAWGWRRKLESGEAHSIKQIAVAENITDRYVSRLLRLTYLAPDIIGAILSGKQKGDFTLEKLRQPIPLDWAEQRAMLRF